MEHQEYQEALTGYAMDALDVSTARTVEEHLATCPSCRTELTELRDAAALLAHDVTPAAPSPGLRAKILANVHAEASTRQTAPAAKNVVAMPARASRLLPNLVRLAAGLVFLALLIGLLVLWRRNVRLQQELAQLSHQSAIEHNELVRDRELVSRQRDALAVMNSADAKKMLMAGTQTASGARGTFVFDQKTGRGVLLAEGLPATPSDKAYMLWFIPKGHTPMAGKIFTVDSSGRAMLPQQVPTEAMVNSVVAITLEPKKGSAVPTGAIYLTSSGS